MKAIGIVFLVFAGFGVVLSVGGGLRTLTQEEGAITGMAIIRTAQSQLLRYGFHALSWAGLGACCLAVSAARKRKPETAGASPSSSTASPAKAPQAASAQAAPTAAPPAPKQATSPVKPATRLSSSKSRRAIRPASDDPPKRNEQDTPGR